VNAAGVPALDHRLIRLKALPDGFQAELIETAERGQAGRGEDSVAEPVEVFRMGSVGTSILVNLDAYRRIRHRPRHCARFRGGGRDRGRVCTAGLFIADIGQDLAQFGDQRIVVRQDALHAVDRVA
jgi:hypothetical protein